MSSRGHGGSLFRRSVARLTPVGAAMALAVLLAGIAEGTCDAAPRGTCRTALKSLLLLVDNNGNDIKDKLKWKWGRGEAVSLQELGVPTGTTSYELCIYAAGNLIDDAEVGPDPLLWVPGTRGYKYKDFTMMSDGIRKIYLTAGEAFKSKALVQGKGINLPDPALELPLPVTVQLVNSSNLCLGAVFDDPGVQYNNMARFKAIAP